jgi:hypothetical protein
VYLPSTEGATPTTKLSPGLHSHVVEVVARSSPLSAAAVVGDAESGFAWPSPEVSRAATMAGSAVVASRLRGLRSGGGS